jgi:hypothetical protein
LARRREADSSRQGGLQWRLRWTFGASWTSG